MSLAMPGTAAAGTWKESGKYMYYVDYRGKKVTGLKKIEKKYYYFDSRGRTIKSKWKTVGRQIAGDTNGELFFQPLSH